MASGQTTGTATVTGLTTAAMVCADINNNTTNSVTVTRVVPTANTITVTLSGDPGVSTAIVSYSVFETA